uniref:C-type isolectin Sp-CL4-like n=1 Tax=Doryrhamphus excisus TaxID=161450 RepID=UPI0025AE602F|nr:C-type isolectin Sp-CL4-like [Doryrhamphus excisus]
MPSAMTTVLLMGALTVTSILAQIYTDEKLREKCATVTLEACNGEACGVYRLNDNSCVKVLSLQRTFAGAQADCQLWNGHVVKVKNEEEHTKLMCMMLRLFPGQYRYWVGAVRGKDGNFYWAGEDTPVEFSPWGEDQPDNYNKRDNCVWMNYNSWGGWNDGLCDDMRSLACQFPIPS